MSIFTIDPVLVDLREEAERHDEWASGRFILRYFTRHAFVEPQWIVGQEIPPQETHCQLRIDTTVQNYDTKLKIFGFRLLAQGKKGRARPADIATVETQAYQVCQSYMLDARWKGKIKAAWAMTYFSSRFRLWACELEGDGMLVPFYPREGDHGDREAYRDLKDFEEDFYWAFETIKSIPEPNPDDFDAIYAYCPSQYQAGQASVADYYEADYYEAGPAVATLSGGQPDSMDADTALDAAETPTVSEADYTVVHVVNPNANDTWTTCRIKHASKMIQLKRKKWYAASIKMKNGKMKAGYAIEAGRDKYCTTDDPSSKGKGRGH